MEEFCGTNENPTIILQRVNMSQAQIHKLKTIHRSGHVAMPRWSNGKRFFRLVWETGYDPLVRQVNTNRLIATDKKTSAVCRGESCSTELC